MPRHFDDLMLGTLELFCRAAELQSFSQAAQALNISPAAVSKTIARLEQKLGSPLFVRTTRHVRLTEAGEQYLSYCRTALDAMYDAENALQDMKTIPAGKIRVCLPNDYAYLKVFPLMPKFRRRYPQIEVDFHLRFRIPRQENTDCDVVMTSWLNYLPDWIATPVDFAMFRIYASPDYLKKAPPLNTPEDLRHHNCLQMHLQEHTRPLRWPLVINNKIEHIETFGDTAFYEDVMAAYYMAVSGNGVAMMHDFIARSAVANGQLVPVLEPWTTVSHIYHIACPADARKSPRIRAFIDFLTEELRPAGAFPEHAVIVPVR
ncbi:LysR family transcriptional regulator [Morganella morganii]|uniref:LysR family transcriptional regulator n=1 Tax=Morganella morganii TaxID=582 RepID=UPI001BD2D8C9|nr:LysR family transcriptional regulator [Morganella morganii]MCU6355937.1 LysR family transcriptional regulator [Morganella morganii]HBL6966668.1 LysR family transcriptional regulator [Morganella morganii]